MARMVSWVRSSTGLRMVTGSYGLQHWNTVTVRYVFLRAPMPAGVMAEAATCTADYTAGCIAHRDGYSRYWALVWDEALFRWEDVTEPEYPKGYKTQAQAKTRVELMHALRA